MEPQHVFLVTGRLRNKESTNGDVKNIIVCSTNEAAVRELIPKTRSDFEIVSVVAMLKFLNTIKMMKANLNGESNECEVYLDPLLEESLTSA